MQKKSPRNILESPSKNTKVMTVPGIIGDDISLSVNPFSSETENSNKILKSNDPVDDIRIKQPISDSQETHQELNQQCQSIFNKTQQPQIDYEIENHQLREQLLNKDEKIKILMNEIKILQDDHSSNFSNQLLIQEADRMIDEGQTVKKLEYIRGLETEISRLSILFAEKKIETEEIEKKLSDQEDVITNLKEYLKQYELKKNELFKQERSSLELRNENQSLKSAIQSVKAKLLEKEAESMCKQQELVLATQEVKFLRYYYQLKTNSCKIKIEEMRHIIDGKENELVKKDQASLKMVEEINHLRKRVKDISSKLKTLTDELTSDYEKRIKEKESEIGVLKEMLKSSKTMVRVKESELERAKKHIVHLDELENSSLPMISEKPGFRLPINSNSVKQSSKPLKFSHTPKSSSISQSFQDRRNFIRKLTLDKNNGTNPIGVIDPYNSQNNRFAYKRDENSFSSFRKTPKQPLSENRESSIDPNEAYSRIRTPEAEGNDIINKEVVRNVNAIINQSSQQNSVDPSEEKEPLNDSSIQHENQ